MRLYLEEEGYSREIFKLVGVLTSVNQNLCDAIDIEMLLHRMSHVPEHRELVCVSR